MLTKLTIDFLAFESNLNVFVPTFSQAKENETAMSTGTYRDNGKREQVIKTCKAEVLNP